MKTAKANEEAAVQDYPAEGRKTMTLVDQLTAEYDRFVAGGMDRNEAARLVDGIMELELEERRKQHQNRTAVKDARLLIQPSATEQSI